MSVPPPAIFDSRWWQAEEIRAATERSVGWLQRRGVGQGDRLAVLSNNRIEIVFAVFAAQAVGARVLMLNARLTSAELAPLIAAYPPKVVLAEEELRSRLSGGDLISDLPTADLRSEIRSPIGPDSPWIELLTSGTTGPPKCVALTAGNFAAHAAAHAKHSGASAADRHYCCLPMFHVGALAMITRAAIHGSSVVIAPGFDPHRFLDDAERHRLTHASLVPTQLIRVLDALGPRPFPDTFKAILVGGGPVSPAVMRRARENGAPVLQTYGLTEACSQVSTEQLADADGESAGRPLPGVEVTIVDGRIHVAGPTVAAQFNGALDTGDLGYLDDQGRLHVLSRRTDLIVTGGENVYPYEVEQALTEIPGVDDAAVGAVTDPVWGQRVAAAITGTTAPADDEITRRLGQRLARFKLPKSYLRLDAVPRNATGKIDRAALRALLENACNGPPRQP